MGEPEQEAAEEGHREESQKARGRDEDQPRLALTPAHLLTKK